MRVVVSPHNVVNYPSSRDAAEDADRVGVLTQRLRRFGIEDRFVLYTEQREFVNWSHERADDIYRSDQEHRDFLLGKGWRELHSHDVAGNPAEAIVERA